jgi:hypothetical protein
MRNQTLSPNFIMQAAIDSNLFRFDGSVETTEAYPYKG